MPQRPRPQADILRFIRLDSDAAVPLATQLAQQILWLIASGEVREGERLPPDRELARHLGINRHTVRAAYHQLEASGLVSMRQGQGTIVLRHDSERLAEAASGTRTFTIGIIIPSISPFYRPFLSAIMDTASGEPWLFFVCYIGDSSELAGRYVDQLTAKRVDGLIVAAGGMQRIGDAMPGRAAPVLPTVYVDTPKAVGYAVLLDSEGAAFRAASHLVGHGHRRIGMITGPMSWPNIRPCYVGYRRALESAGLAVDDELIVEEPAFQVEGGFQAAEKLLDLPEPPTAIFGAADQFGIGAMRAAKARGLRVPEDIAVASYNDTQMAALVDPPLTAAHAPTYEMGVTAMTMLKRLMAGETVRPRRVTLDTPLVIRRSCGCGGP